MESLISVDTEDFVPVINARGPHSRVIVQVWERKMLEDLGLPVTVHQEPYDPVASHNDAVTKVNQDAPVAEVAPALKTEAEQPAPVAEPEVAAEEQDVPADEAPSVDLDELKVRVEALTTFKDAKALIAELGLELTPAPTKLTEAREALLKLISEAAEGAE